MLKQQRQVNGAPAVGTHYNEYVMFPYSRTPHFQSYTTKSGFSSIKYAIQSKAIVIQFVNLFKSHYSFFVFNP